MTLTSKLDAVNTILGTAGESAVQTLDGTTADAANAEAVLDEVTRSVQAEGWHFNTEDGVKFTPTVEGEILLPANVLSFDIRPDASVDPIQRGQKLYDKLNHRYTFTKPLEATVVYLLPFTELPEQARHYITVRAARIFIDRFIGSDSKRGFTAEDENRARVVLQSSDLRNADTNIFRSDPRMAWALRRR